MNCKSIILAGGSGTRLWPITKGTSKQLLPIYDKPLIYYPLSTIMLAGIRDILIITTPEDNEYFKRLLGDGSQFGINLTYAVQERPEGIAQAFLIAEECGFLKPYEPCSLILGDNIFHFNSMTKALEKALLMSATMNSACVFSIQVKDPWRYGIIEVDGNNVVSIEEKPKEPKSNLCVTGLYFYPGNVIEKVHKIKPSTRGELEITDLNKLYLEEGRLGLVSLPRGSVWFDAGTIDSLFEASGFIEAVEKRSGIMIGCPEEIAYHKKWITKEKLLELAEEMNKTEYGKYLQTIANSKYGRQK